MNIILNFISNMIVPLIFLLFILYGYINKVKVYDTFIIGAKDGIKIIFEVLPTLIGLMIAVGVLNASGTLDIIERLLSPIAKLINFPTEAIPIVLMKPISSSAATGLFLNLLKEQGPDSFASRFIAISLGSTETIFYTLSVYFLSVGIKKTRYTLSGAIFTMVISVFVSFILALVYQQS